MCRCACGRVETKNYRTLEARETIPVCVSDYNGLCVRCGHKPRPTTDGSRQGWAWMDAWPLKSRLHQVALLAPAYTQESA